MNPATDHARRRFLQQGAGLVVAIAFAPELAAAEAPGGVLPGSLAQNPKLSSWLRIEPGGGVTLFTGKMELGQGIGTALAQIAAEELDVAYARVAVVMPDTERTPNEGMTAGSQSIEQSGTAVRFACAEAKSILLGAAAARLSVPVESLQVKDGTVSGPGGAAITYWSLAADASLAREATAKVHPKDARDYVIVGQSLERRDLPAKFTGTPFYVQDLRFDGMVHARVVRPPLPGAQFVALDEAPIRAMPGFVALVRDGNFLAVACEREEQAIAAREAMRARAQWRLPPAQAMPQILEQARPPTPPEVIDEKKADAPGAARVIEARYSRPFQLHASIGPSCALARSEEGRLQVWTHSQGVFPLRAHIARGLGIDAAAIQCIHAPGSGCYGHNGADDAAFDAALVARAVPGRHVRLQWMRDDEFQWEPCGPAMSMHLRAGVDARGRIVDWQHELWSYSHAQRPGGKDGVNLLAAALLAQPFQSTTVKDIAPPARGSDRNAIPLYVFPKQRIVKHFMTEAPLRASALRSLGAYGNVFAIESFIDEIALATGSDPVAIRAAHLTNARAREVIDAVARASGWQAGATGDGGKTRERVFKGRGLGFAQYKNHACYCAVVVDVEVDRDSGVVRVPRAWAAADAGQVVNPDGVVNQIEGGLIQSTSWTLKESLPFDAGGSRAASWADYPILRFDEVPEVRVELVARPGEASLGVGEGAQGPTAAAIGNAIAAATGRRMRDIPFTPSIVKAALI